MTDISISGDTLGRQRLLPLVFAVLLVLSLFAARAAPAGESQAKLLDDVAVRLEPCDPFPYVEPGAKGKVSFLFTSKADHELQLTWKVQIGLPSGKGPDLEERLVLPKGGSKRVALPDQITARRGVVSFVWQLTDQDGRALALLDTLGVMTLPGPETSHRAGFRFGWGNGLVHFVPQPGEEKCMATYARMGIDLMRVGDKWAYADRGGNYWDSTELIVNGASAAGMDLLYVMWGTPRNRSRAEFSNQGKVAEMATATKTPLDLMERVRPPDPAAWRTRVKDTVTRFKDRKTLNQHSYFQITPAGCAYVHAIGLLRMLPSNARLVTGTAGQWLFAFSDPTGKDPRQVVGLWHDDKMSDATVRLRVGAKATCNLLDLYGNAEPVVVGADGTVSILVKHCPTYLLVVGGDAVTVVR